MKLGLALARLQAKSESKALKKLFMSRLIQIRDAQQSNELRVKSHI